MPIIPACPCGAGALDLHQLDIANPDVVVGHCPGCGEVFGVLPLVDEAGWGVAGPADVLAALR
jgi:hypothetical protein